MSEDNRPNFLRFQRVAEIVCSEPAMKTRLGAKTELVLKPNGDKIEFSKAIVDLTERIHAAGHDANLMPRQEILRLAVDVIVRGEDGDLPPAPKRPPEPVAAESVNGEHKPKRKKPEPKPKPEPKAEPKPEPKPVAAKPKKPRKKVQKAPEPVAAVEEKPAAKPEPKVVAPPPPAPAAPVVAAPQTAILIQNSVLPYAVGCAVVSALFGALQLLEINDKTPEGLEIRSRLDKITVEVQARTKIPSNGQ